MRSYRLLCCLALAAACGTSNSASPTTGTATPLSAAAKDEAPPHRFSPRPHPARVRPAIPAPRLASLPAMIDRIDQCMPPPEPMRPPPVATKPPPRKRGRSGGKKGGGRTPPGFVPYTPGAGGGGSSSGAKSSGASTPKPDPKPSKPKKKKKPKNRKKLEKSKDAGGPLGGVALPSASPPPPEPEPAPAEAPADALADLDAGESQREAEQPSPAGNRADNGADGWAEDDGALQIAQSDPDERFDDWGAAIYLSNDDTMSLSSAQRVIFAIDNFQPLPAEHIRPHELLNYFSFDTAEVGRTDDFSVHAEVAPDPNEPGIYSLGMAVKGRPMGVDERRNANLTYVIDRSGSMDAEGRMEFLKRGLRKSMSELKRGDVVHLVAFDHSVCTPVENFVVGRDSMSVLQRAIDRMEPRGSTDLHAGLNEGYRIADRAYQPEYTNRVIMVTDALANTGVTDQELIATVGKYYDSRRIRLSGVGVGSEFNDALLDRLTERGKGAYVFLGSEAEVDAVFGPRFVSLIETTALDVHFRLHLPPSLRMNVFYGEESSTVKEDVQAIHYFANTSQLFLSDLMARRGKLRTQDDVMLTVEYEDPETGDDMVEEFAFNLGEITEQTRNVDKGRLIMRFVDGLSWMASRNLPRSWSRGEGRWEDADAWMACEEGREDLGRMARGLDDDPEVRRVMGLWDKYCARYSRPREPVRRPAAQDTWPGAAG